MATEQEARKHAENQAQDTKVKVVSDMSMLKPSECWKMADDDRIRGVLQSESSSKGKGERQRPRRNKMFHPQELYSFYQDFSGPMSEEKIESLMSKNVKSPAELERKETRPKLDKGKGKRKQYNTSPKGKSNGECSGKGKQSKDQSITRKGKSNGKNKKSFTDVEPNKGQLYAC